MVRLLKRGPSLDKPTQGRERMCEISGRPAQSLILEGAGGNEENKIFRSHGANMGCPIDGQQIGWALDRSPSNAPKSRLGKGGRDGMPSGNSRCIQLESYFMISMLIDAVGK